MFKFNAVFFSPNASSTISNAKCPKKNSRLLRHLPKGLQGAAVALVKDTFIYVVGGKRRKKKIYYVYNGKEEQFLA